MGVLYDTIGVSYSEVRSPDPRIAEIICSALGPARTVLNVGAGTGSYEPDDRELTALEPSLAMIRQRDPSAAPAIQGSAESLPFADDSFDASMAVLTVHHWMDKAKGLAEMRRVTRGSVANHTSDPSYDVRTHRGAWLTDYIPELVDLDRAQMPEMSNYEKWLGPVRIEAVPIPHDCTDGFLYAWWRRPAADLDERVRAGSSSFWAIENAGPGLARLAEDIASGEWEKRYGDLLAMDECDAGYRLVTTR